MVKRGAPGPGDTPGCQLTLDYFVFMFRLLIRGDVNNFFVEPDWQNALVSFLGQHKTRAPIMAEISKVTH
ncbi:hypothetical protein F4774DRAFT_414323 [Daldinia eschscholtzii]|nr:hypothetical protein F4774DRAFT_414323 [Daldinia eschscholtzii]